MLVKMQADNRDIERIASEMSGRFDEAAAWIAHEMAEIADKLFDKHSAAWWQYIAGATLQGAVHDSGRGGRLRVNPDFSPSI